MSNENKELSTSWVLVEPSKGDEKLDEGIDNVEDTAEGRGDSDSDSISIISESSCSYKGDVEELLLPTSVTEVDLVESPKENDEIHGNEIQEEIETITELQLMDYDSREAIDYLIDSRFNFIITSSFYVIVFIAFTMALQYYFDSTNVSSNISTQSNNFNSPDPSHAKTECYVSKKSQSKSCIDAKCEVTKPTVYNKDDDHYQRTLESNFRPTKNKNAINKENSNAGLMIDEFNSDLAKEQYQEKMIELQLKEAYLNKKEKNLIRKEDDLKKKENQLNNMKDGKKNNKSKFKKEEKCGKKKCKIDKREEKKQPKQEKRFKQSDTKEYHKYSHASKKQNFDNHEEQPKRNFSGQWYINLHKARRYIREKEHASDWVFDRAQMRSTKRNKAFWYFQWMFDRSRHRMK